MEDGDMTAALAARPVRVPRGTGAAARLASLARDPLAGYLSMSAACGDIIRVPISPKSRFFVLSRPEYAARAGGEPGQLRQGLHLTGRSGRSWGNGLLTSER